MPSLETTRSKTRRLYRCGRTKRRNRQLCSSGGANGRLNAGFTEAELQLYGVRYAYATMLLEAGMTDFESTRLMGHRSIVTTTRVYGHLRPERLGQVQDQLDRAFGEG